MKQDLKNVAKKIKKLLAGEPKKEDLDLLGKIEKKLSGSSGMSIKKLLEGVSDEYYFWLLTDGYENIGNGPLKALLPIMPDEQTQTRFTGKAGKAALEEAFSAFKLFKKIAADHSKDLGGCDHVLDFGCGWGRIIRFFLKDVEPSSLHGADAVEPVIEICKQSNINADFRLISNVPPIDFPDGMFDVIYLYSVFSHLSEDACMKWVNEFHRILKPGGVLIATTRRRAFIEYCKQMSETKKDLPSWTKAASMAFSDNEQALQDYDDGKFCFSPTKGGGYYDVDFYGEAAIPKKYVDEHWTKIFPKVEFIYETEHKSFGQNVIVAIR